MDTLKKKGRSLADTPNFHSLYLLSKIGEHLIPTGSLRGAAAAVGSFGLLLVRPFNCYPLDGMRDLLTFFASVGMASI